MIGSLKLFEMDETSLLSLLKSSEEATPLEETKEESLEDDSPGFGAQENKRVPKHKIMNRFIFLSIIVLTIRLIL